MQTAHDIERIADTARKTDCSDYYEQRRNEEEYAERLREDLDSRAKDKFQALPDFYTCVDSIHRYTNMDDAIQSLTQPQYIAIARALRDGKHEEAGKLLADALMQVCRKNAEWEIEDEIDRRFV